MNKPDHVREALQQSLAETREKIEKCVSRSKQLSRDADDNARELGQHHEKESQLLDAIEEHDGRKK